VKYLVTGGAGFIGSHLVDKLLERGHSVAVIDNFSLGKRENLSQHQDNGQLVVYPKNICADLTEVFESGEIGAVLHLAALPRVQFSVKNPLPTHQANVNGTLNLLESCRRFGIKRFVFSSSSSVYGSRKMLPLREEMFPHPISPYAVQKLVGEQYCRLYHGLYGLETICLRYFNVFGPRQSPQGDYAGLIPKFIKLIGQNLCPTINGDGEQTRDFTFVSGVVEANLLAADTPDPACFGEVFNVGTGQNISVNQVASNLLSLSGKKMEALHGPAILEPKNSLADVSKIQNYLGWNPKVSFESGLEKTYEYFTVSCPNSISLERSYAN